MEHLTTETIVKFTKGEYQFQQLREISAHLLTCPADCLGRLKEIDPEFLEEAAKLENARIKEETQGTHLSDAEIEAYVTKKFNLEERLKMNKHLVKCRLCISKLVNRDPDYLRSFMRDNLAWEHSPEIVAREEKPQFNLSILIPVATFALLLIIFLITILMLPNNQFIDQAKVQELSKPNPLTNLLSKTDGNKNSANTGNSNQQISETSSHSNRDIKKQNNDSNSEPAAKTVYIPTTQRQSKKVITNQRQDIIVKNRSLNKNCDNNPELAVTPNNEIITQTQPNLTWKSLAKASSYKIYVSDMENNLVEKSNPSDAKQTSYKLSKKLDLNKKYEWKVVVTLTNGKEVYSEAAYFSVGEKAKKLPKPKGKLKVNEVRCLKSQN